MVLRKCWAIVAVVVLIGAVAAGVAAEMKNVPPGDATAAGTTRAAQLAHVSGGNYQGWGYSELDTITADNVSKLRPVWTLSTGVDRRPSGTAHRERRHHVPRHADESGDHAGCENRVTSFGATNARFRRNCSSSIPPGRGVGLWEDKVFFATTDCFLVALEAKTGKVLWETEV